MPMNSAPLITHVNDEFFKLVEEYKSKGSGNKEEFESIDLDHNEWTQKDQDLCAKIHSSKQGVLFSKLFSGDISGYGSQSEADQALCNILAFWTQKDSKQIYRIFNASDLSKRDKWREREDYPKRTISRAIEDTDEVYQRKTEVSPDANHKITNPYASKFRFITADEITREIRPTDWLIEGFLEANALAVLFAPAGTFKTFLALSWGLAIATGTPWFGKKVKQGFVLFIIGEGHTGFGKRIKAWSLGNDVDISDCPLLVSTAPAQMLSEQSAQHVQKCIQEYQPVYGDPLLVVFDTLARNFGPGDENSTADMSKFVAHLDHYIGNDCTRLLIHHTGHTETNRGRGSSVLRGAADAEFKIANKRKDNIVLSCEKMKDAPEFKDKAFCPVGVPIYTTKLLNPDSSIYLVEADAPEDRDKNLSPQMKLALSLLDLMTPSTGGGNENQCISSINTWMHLCIEQEVYGRTAFYNAIKTLEERELIEISGNNVRNLRCINTVLAES